MRYPRALATLHDYNRRLKPAKRSFGLQTGVCTGRIIRAHHQRTNSADAFPHRAGNLELSTADEVIE
jgi:hypothetical protein